MKGGEFKISKAMSGGGALKAYQRLVIGSESLWDLVVYELVMLASSWVPGALGLLLRRLLYPLLLGSCGKGCIFGRGVVLRHPHKIHLGDGVVLDDGAMVDAKGEGNRVVLAEGVYVGRGSIIYTKGGDIELGKGVNISHNCELFSSNKLVVGPGTFIAAYSYLLSGGQYDPDSDQPFAEQPGTMSRGATVVGENVWIAAHVVVTDGVKIGDGAVVGAGAIVMDDIPPQVLAVGMPARVVRKLGSSEGKNDS